MNSIPTREILESLDNGMDKAATCRLLSRLLGMFPSDYTLIELAESSLEPFALIMKLKLL
jgi:hypothetical protein